MAHQFFTTPTEDATKVPLIPYLSLLTNRQPWPTTQLSPSFQVSARPIAASMLTHYSLLPAITTRSNPCVSMRAHIHTSPGSCKNAHYGLPLTSTEGSTSVFLRENSLQGHHWTSLAGHNFLDTHESSPSMGFASSMLAHCLPPTCSNALFATMAAHRIPPPQPDIIKVV